MGKAIRSEDWSVVTKSGECFAEDVEAGEFGFLFNTETGEARMIRGIEFQMTVDRLVSDGCSVVSNFDNEVLFRITPETPII